MGYSNRGQAYSDKGETDKALTDLKKAIELDPKYADAYNNLGVLYVKTGDNEKAIVNFKKALEIDPNHKNAANNLKEVSK